MSTSTFLPFLSPFCVSSCVSRLSLAHAMVQISFIPMICQIICVYHKTAINVQDIHQSLTKHVNKKGHLKKSLEI